MTATIDMHCHWLPAALAEELRARTRVPRIALTDAGGERLHIFGEVLPFSDAYMDIPSRLDHMDRNSVEQHVLSLPGLFGIDSLKVDQALPLVQLFNDTLAALIEEHPTRFQGLAALPLADIEAASNELRRARSRLGLVGAILPADGFRNRPAANRFEPLFTVGQEIGAHFFIHPGPLPRPGEGHDVSEAEGIDNENQRHVSLAVQNRLSEVMVTLTMTDFLEPFGNVSVQVANLGGDLPWLLERMDQVAALRDPDSALPSGEARTSRVFVDCSSFGPRAIQMAIDTFGTERLLFGTDHPIFETERSMAAIDQLALSSTERSAILRDNALSLLSR